MIRHLLLATLLFLGIATVPAPAPAAEFLPTTTLAQAAAAPAQQNNQSSGTRVRGRSIKGMVKLAIFGGVVLLGAGGWVLTKMGGE